MKYTADEVERESLDCGQPCEAMLLAFAATIRSQEQEAKRENCAWTQEEEGGWETDCGQRWEFFHGGPLENQIRFCHGCGKPTKVIPFTENEEVGT